MTIEINRKELLRYLSYNNQEISNDLNTLINESIRDIKMNLEEKTIYKFFPLNKEKELTVEGTNIILKGEDIRKHLENSDSLILIGVSLGHKVDTLIRYFEKINMTKAIILDACGSVAIESIIDRVNNNLEKKVSKDNMTLTSRYSPGYGDLPLDTQKSILDALEAQKNIGLNLTSHNILIPRKSVTAIIGAMDSKYGKIEYNCLDCSMYENCSFSKGGYKCGA